MAIAPAWTNIYICPQENGHIQSNGFDARERKKYRYYLFSNISCNETKFHKLLEFGSQLPSPRLQVEKDHSLLDLNEKKVVAAVISLMERTYIMIGNTEYEKLNESHGLTTFHDKHVNIEGPGIVFFLKGKKGFTIILS